MWVRVMGVWRALLIVIMLCGTSAGRTRQHDDGGVNHGPQ
jgi:hypothetical protein